MLERNNERSGFQLRTKVMRSRCAGPLHDIVWRNSSSGDVQLWNSNGSGGFTIEDLGVHTGWQIEGAGDFNGGGPDGILWQNSSSGIVQLWNSNGSGGFTEQNLGVHSGWTIFKQD